MKRLTKKEALQLSSEMWHWLAEHPGKDKIDYFEEYEEKEWPSQLCYACEYDIQRRNRKCCIIPIFNSDCCNKLSPYIKWDHGTCSSAALEIAKSADETLAKLNKKRGNV